MKSVGTALLVLALSGCAGATIEQTSMVANDGARFYFLKDLMYGESNRERTVKYLDERAKRVCPSGYDLISEEKEQLRGGLGQDFPGAYKLHWQIKCKNAS